MSSSNASELLNNIIAHYLLNESHIHQSLPFILDVIVSHRLLKGNVEKSDELAAVYRKWTVRLNALLQSKNVMARWSAICLIRASCENSHYLFINNAKAWAAQLLGFLAKAEPVMIHRESIETLSFVFSYTADKPELHREVATPNMQRYNQLLLQLARNQELLSTVLSALTINVKHFPANARHISDQCLQLCLSCLDGSKDMDASILSKANECLASLYNAGGKSVMAKQWNDSLNQLIGSVHDCLNRLFDTVDEEAQISELPKSYPFTAVSTDYIAAFPILLKRVQLLEDCICTFLTLPTTIPVGVPTTQLVDLICRIYSVYEGSMMREFKDRSEFLTLVMCLPSIHLSTSKMFASLLYCTGQDMVRYSKLFSRILHRLLSEYQHKRTMKISIYKLVTLCLEKCDYSFAENIHKPLITAILNDLSIIQHKVTGITNTNSNQQKKSHKKRRTEVTNSDALSTTTKLMSAAPSDVQIASLQTLSSLYDVYGFAMENGSRASVDSTILSRLIQLIQPANMTVEEMMLVKAELFNCLLASVTHPIETQASILPHAARLFSSGLNEPSYRLQSICRKGLAMCDLIMHARLPPVQRATPKSIPHTVVITAQEETEEEENEAEEHVNITDNKESLVNTEAAPTPEQKKVEHKEAIEVPQAPSPPVQHPEPKSAPRTLIFTAQETKEENKAEDSGDVTDNRETADSMEVSLIAEHKEVIEVPKVEKPLPSATVVIDSDVDMDLDMEMPVIDMAGPDTDEDDE